MKKAEKPAMDNPFINAAGANLQLTIFDQQDGKLIDGIIIEIADSWFALKCADGQIRKFDIKQLPKEWNLERFLLPSKKARRNAA